MRHARNRKRPSFGIYIFLCGLVIILIGSRYSYNVIASSINVERRSGQVKIPTSSPQTQVNNEKKDTNHLVGDYDNKVSNRTPTVVQPSKQSIEGLQSLNDIIKVNMRLQVVAKLGQIRSGPGKNQKVVSSFKKDSILFANMMVTNGKDIWYHIHSEDREGWILDKIVKHVTPSKDGILLNAPLISQMPELQRGCEVTSLAMLLNNLGVKVTKMQLAKEVKKDPTSFQRKDGGIYFGNPNNGFVGNIYDIKKPGLGVYHEPIFALAQKYLGKSAIDITGKGFDAVIHQLNQHRPVWVILSSTFKPLPESAWETWETPTGKVRITYSEHSVLVTGYDEKYIYFNDPLADKKASRVKKSDFIPSWKQFGEQAISYS